MMLHTDAFNRNNKHKMAKADYVKNTRLDGIPTLVLEVGR
jgi:Sec7-like guanine-nucleotide exchange factor